MTIKEITAMRKSGQLGEALKAAEAEFAAGANGYTANALFWCLYDLAKGQSDQECQASYERMKTLSEYIGANEYVEGAIGAIGRRLDPLAIELKNAIALAKSGQVEEELLTRLRAMFARGELKDNLYTDFGWYIYHVLKNTPVGDFNRRKLLLHDYVKLELPRPHLLHSMILREAVTVEKNTPYQFRIRDFMNLWGWDNLREEDWEQYKAENGNTVTSLVEKLISVYAKEVKDDRIQSPAEFDALVDKALAMYPRSQNMPLYKAIVLKSKGRYAEALESYKSMLLKSPSKCYLWHQASELVDDLDMKIALLCKAIIVERNEKFTGRCRLDLAKALIQKGLPAHAKYELDKFSSYYTSQGWWLKPEYYEVERGIPAGIEAEDNGLLYKKYLPLADDFVYSAISPVFAIKIADKEMEEKSRPGKKYMQWTLRSSTGIHYLKKPAKYGLENTSANGSVFDIKLHEGKIVWIGPTAQNPLDHDWIKKSEGIARLRVDRKGHPYAILDDAYIGPRLLQGVYDGARVKIIAIRQEDGRWAALSLKRM